MSWSSIFNQTLHPDTSSRNYLIVEIDGVTGQRLAVTSTAPDAKPTWFLACRLFVSSTLADFPGNPLVVEAQQQTIRLNRNQILDLSGVSAPYKLRLEIPFWFQEIAISIWQELADPLNQGARVVLSVDSVGQSLFELPFSPPAPELTELYVNGVKALYPVEYVINNVQLSWLDSLQLSPGDEVELIY